MCAEPSAGGNGKVGRQGSLLAGRTPAPPRVAARPPLEPLSDSEIRVLRYLPTNLSAPEISNEATLSFSVAPCSDPATIDQYTDFGSCLWARRCATATVSNHLLLIAILAGPT